VDGASWSSGKDLWSDAKPQVNGSVVRVTVADRDAAVIRLAR
jgi:hypothetical protein